MRFPRVALLMVFINGVMSSASLGSQPECVAPELTENQVHEIVVEERAIRDDLPVAFPEYRWTARKQGCHYVYIEYGLPEIMEHYYMFRLNQHGVIVDLQAGGQTVKINCPGGVLEESELTAIVRQARKERSDLPSAFPKQRTRVDRSGCLYFYFEYNVPERRGDYQVFTIDPLGEVMYFSRSEPQ